VAIRRLSPGDELEGEPHLIQLREPQFNALRSQYLNPKIVVGGVQLSLGIMVGDRLVGVVALSLGQSNRAAKGVDLPAIYLMSDFPVAPTDYPRLSRLIVMAALSKEVRQMAERLSNGRIRSIVTTAFSSKPVSMKYRGLLDLTSRKEEGSGFALNYGGPAGQWTLAEAYEQWRSKHLR